MKMIKEYLEQEIKVKKIDDTAKDLRKEMTNIILSNGIKHSIMFTCLKTHYIKNTISFTIKFLNGKTCEFTKDDIKHKKDECIKLIKELSKP